jgi:MFS family permease
VLGEWVRASWGFQPAWATAASLCVLAAIIGAQIPEDKPTFDPDAPPPTSRWFHPAAIRPGIVLALSACGYAGFAAFVPLYIKEVGLGSAGGVFAEYAVAVLAVRVFAARLPDRIGSIRGASIAMVLQAIGLGAMAVFASAVGLYASTLVFAMGTSLLYPSLFPLVVDRAPDSERSQAVATFTLFFDIAQGLGAAFLGLLVTIGGGERWAFAGASVLIALGFVVLRSGAKTGYDVAPVVS